MSALFLGTGALSAIRSEKSFLTCNSLFIIFCHCSCLIKKCKNINKSYKTSCKLLEWGWPVLLLSLFWQRLILCILQEHTRKSVASYSAQRGNLSLFPWWWHNVFFLGSNYFSAVCNSRMSWCQYVIQTFHNPAKLLVFLYICGNYFLMGSLSESNNFLILIWNVLHFSLPPFYCYEGQIYRELSLGLNDILHLCSIWWGNILPLVHDGWNPA